MTYLADINVWVAIAVTQHTHQAAAKRWFDSCDGPIAFCRITQMGFLRLLTNPRVLADDVFNPMQAWRLYDRFLEDDRILYLPENREMEAEWREATARTQPGSNFWTDAYLAAFARTAGCTVVTFDSDFRKYKADWLLLKNDR